MKNLSGQLRNWPEIYMESKSVFFDSRQYFGLNYADRVWYERHGGGIPTLWFSGNYADKVDDIAIIQGGAIDE